jgi:DNA-binding MarR family transcriptional regulator
MGKHAKIEAGRKVASVFVPISRSGLSKQLRGHEWRKDLLMSWLFQTCIRLQTSLDRRFLRFGMTVQEASVLLRCVEVRRITPGELAVGLGRDKGMITRFIDRLELSRLIIRGTNPRDRRFSVIKPTAKGKQVAQNLAYVFDEIRKELFVGLLESDVRRLSRMMAQLHKNAVGIGSRQKCEAMRRRRSIGRQRMKTDSSQRSRPQLAGEILAPFADHLPFLA